MRLVDDPGAADLRASVDGQDGTAGTVEGGDGDVVGTGAYLYSLTCPDAVGGYGVERCLERDQRVVSDAP